MLPGKQKEMHLQSHQPYPTQVLRVLPPSSKPTSAPPPYRKSNRPPEWIRTADQQSPDDNLLDTISISKVQHQLKRLPNDSVPGPNAIDLKSWKLMPSGSEAFTTTYQEVEGHKLVWNTGCSSVSPTNVSPTCHYTYRWYFA